MNPLSMQEVINKFLKENILESEYQCAIIAINWKNILKLPASNEIRKVFFKKNKMYIFVSSASLKQELFMRRKIFLKKLNEFVNKSLIREIIFL